MGMRDPNGKDRLSVVRSALATVIADELEAVEDEVGYVRPSELVRVMFDIAVKYGKETNVGVQEIESLFGSVVDRHTQFTIVLGGPMAEA